MSFKPSVALRFLAGLGLGLLILGLVLLRVLSHRAPPAPALPPPPPPPVTRTDCARGPLAAAAANAASLRVLPWAPFRRPEQGWAIYAPLIGREIGAGCPPASPGFAAALARWEQHQQLPADGVLSDADFVRMKGVLQTRRPFVLVSARGVCPPPPPDRELAPGRPGEGYGGKQIWLRPAVWDAYRRMAAAARAEDPRIAADPRDLTIFSGYRSPALDAARCARDGNCNGVTRAACSPHRTGLALDLYVGQAPGYGPDSSADPNRLFMSQTPAYQWLVANADRFGFVNYPFEPWHWEWTGDSP